MIPAEVLIAPVAAGNAGAAAGFLAEWVLDDGADSREYLAGHGADGGASLIAVRADRVIGIVCLLWESAYAGFRDQDIPLVHQLCVAEPFRRQGVATRLMDAAEALARDRGVRTLGITVGLFDAYGPAQRLYARRGYVPDGRGACQGQQPLRPGDRVTVDDDLIMWLAKDLAW